MTVPAWIYVASLLGLIPVVVRWPPVAASIFFCVIAIDHLGVALVPGLRGVPIAINAYIGTLMLLALLVTRLRPLRLPLPLHTNVAASGALLLLLYSGVSTIWTPYDGVLGIWSVRLPYHILGIVVVPLLFRSIRDIDYFLTGLLAVGTPLVAALAFAVEWSNRAIVFPGFAQLTLLDPLGIAMVGGAVFVVGMLFWERGSPSLHALRLIAVLVSSFLVVVKTESRGQVVAMVISFAALLPFLIGTVRPGRAIAALFWAAVSIGAVYYLIGEFVSEGVRWQTDRVAQDWAGRLGMATRLLESWWRDPVTLLFGLGNSASYVPKIIGVYPHIVVVEVLAEEGLVGFGIFLAVLLVGLRSGWHIATGKWPAIRMGSRCAIVGLALFYFLLSFKQGSLMNSYFLLSGIVILSRALQLYEREGDARSVKRNPLKENSLLQASGEINLRNYTT